MPISSVGLKTHFTLHKANYESTNYGSLLEITGMVFDSILRALRSFMVKKIYGIIINEHFLNIFDYGTSFPKEHLTSLKILVFQSTYFET